MGLVVLTAAPGAVVASESRILKRALFKVARDRCEAADALADLSEQLRSQGKLTRIASRAEGEKEGKERALNQLAERLTRAAVAERVELEHIRPTIVQLVSNVVNSVLSSVDKQVWFDQALLAVGQQLSLCQRVVFTVHPDSATHLKNAIKACPHDLGGTIKIVEDPNVALDVCDVASDHGFSTCSISRQISNVEQAVGNMIADIVTSPRVDEEGRDPDGE